MADQAFVRTFEIQGGDFVKAGHASTRIKDTLKELGIAPPVVRRTAIASYEAEMNVVMYARRATMTLTVTPARIRIDVNDEGPGIVDLALAMQEGYSTATPEMREMGFGAGMGLPNIRRNSDDFELHSDVGRGTDVSIGVHVR